MSDENFLDIRDEIRSGMGFAKALYDRGSYRECIKVCGEVLTIRAMNLSALILTASALRNCGQLAEAICSLKGILEAIDEGAIAAPHGRRRKIASYLEKWEEERKNAASLVKVHSRSCKEPDSAETHF